MESETLEVKVPRELLVGREKGKFVDEMKLFTAKKLYEMNALKYSKEELDEEMMFLRKK